MSKRKQTNNYAIISPFPVFLRVLCALCGELLRLLRILVLDETSDALANVYLREKIIPPKKLEDAQHIAIATCNQMDILLSWNFKHLSNIQKQIGVKIINEKEGYFYPLILTNPMEVVYENE